MVVQYFMLILAARSAFGQNQTTAYPDVNTNVSAATTAAVTLRTSDGTATPGTTPVSTTTASNVDTTFPIISCDSAKFLPYHCADNSTCIDRYSFCDNVTHCPDGSDEIEFKNSTSSLGLRCQFNNAENRRTNKFCHLPDRYKCDHELDCVGGQDECGCRHTFQCDNNDCALKIQFCNGSPECRDETDERIYNRSTPNGFQCPVSKRHDTRNCVLPDRYVCDGDSDCDHGVDECFCKFAAGNSRGDYVTNSYSNGACFRCLDNSTIIPKKQLCDGVIHCQDLSDECMCSGKKNHTVPEICDSVCLGHNCSCKGQVQCNDQNGTLVCLSPTAICDDRFNCLDSLDERFCPKSDQIVTCADGRQKIPKTRLCNGHPDCDDESDERNCHTKFDYFCEAYRRYFIGRGPSPKVTDWNNKTQTAKVWIPMELSTTNPFFSKRCDGEPTCISLDDECYANGTACSNKTRPAYCKYVLSFGSGLRCNNSRSSVIGRETCDGFPTCNDTDPAGSIDELFCPNRFYCKDKGKTRLPIHIPLSSRCDQIQDCADQSDEMGCSESSHFYCTDTSFIRRSEVCDGTMDCSSGIDECQECATGPFSSDDKLISSRALVAFLWIIGVLSTVGNVAVIIHQLKNLIGSHEHSSQIVFTNRILVLNLAVADLLVGIYLVAIGIKDASVSRYCLQDQEWRSSTTCSGLGTVALIGTETSIFVLLIMTAYRMYLVIRPFKKSGNRIFICVALVFAWTLSLLLSLVPLSSTFRDYFVSCVWYENNPFFGLICKSSMMDFAEDLYSRYGGNGQFSSLSGGVYNWNTMIDAIAQFNSSYTPRRYFGYYSAHGVCLPRLFPSPEQDLSWGYSMFLILFNFFAFAFILSTYIQIYRITVKRQHNLQSEERAGERAIALQNKITRIVASDFCCWMPICIMAFVKVSGVYISDIAYAFTAVILLPINSAMNPLLYSDIVDIGWEKLLPVRTWFSGRVTQRTRRGFSVSTDVSPTKTTSGNMKSLKSKSLPRSESTM